MGCQKKIAEKIVEKKADYYLCTNLKWLAEKDEWKNLCGIGMVRSSRLTKDGESTELRQGKKRQQCTEFEYYKKTCYELIKGFRFANHYKKEESYNRQQTDTLFKKRKMSALRFAESIMRLP